MKTLKITIILGAILCSTFLIAQNSQKTILFDVAHKQEFYIDDADTSSAKPWQIKRNKYILNEMDKNAGAFEAEVVLLKEKISTQNLSNADLLFIRVPKAKHDKQEIKAIHNYLDNGGSLLLVMDVEYWVKLSEITVNDIIAPYDIQFGPDAPDTISGGYSVESIVTPTSWKIPYHSARIVKGGTPFCYNIQSKKNPFAVYKELDNGGKIIVMGEAMVTLYMNKWQDVDDYQCSGFMGDVFKWLLD